MSHIKFRFPRPRSMSQSKVYHLQIVSAITSKTNEVNLFKLYRKLKRNKKVCRAQKLGSHDKVKVTVIASPLTNHVSTIPQKGLGKYDQISEKVKQSKGKCHAQSFGSHYPSLRS